MHKIGRAWVGRLAKALNVGADCVVLDPPFVSEDSLDSKGFWLRPVARRPEERVRLLRKQAFTGLVELLTGVVRWDPQLVMGYGQGAFIVALASMPLVLESACRARIVTPEDMRSFRKAWSRVKALVAVNPCVMPSGSCVEMVKQAIPELVKLQPTGIYREVLYSDMQVHKEFILELGALVASPCETNRFRDAMLKAALLAPNPVYFEDESGGVGLCCVCAKKGVLGRCLKCGCTTPVQPQNFREGLSLAPGAPGKSTKNQPPGPTKWKWGRLAGVCTKHQRLEWTRERMLKYPSRCRESSPMKRPGTPATKTWKIGIAGPRQPAWPARAPPAWSSDLSRIPSSTRRMSSSKIRIPRRATKSP